MKRALLLAFLIIQVSLCDRKYFEGTRIKQMDDTTQMAVMTLKEDMNYVIFYHTTTRKCSDCERYAKVLIELANKWKGVINVFELDCGRVEKLDGSSRASVQKCMRESDHELPKIDFYEPPTTKWDNVKNNMALAELRNYAGPPDLDFMEEFMLKHMANYGKTFYTFHHLNAYLKEDYVGAKALVFISDDGVTPVMKALTAFFVDRLDLAFIHPELDEVIEKYGVDVEKTPQMVILRKDTETGAWKKPIKYKGAWEYLKVRNFGQKYALPYKNVKPEHNFFDQERFAKQEEKRMSAEERKKAQASRAARKKYLYHFDETSFEQEMIKRKDDIVLVHAYSQKSGKHKQWESIVRKLKGLAIFYEINPVLPANKELVDEEYLGLEPPFIALYPPGELQKKRKGRRIYSSQASFKKMATFVSDHTKDPSQQVNKESMRIVITNSLYSYKGACILYHNNPSTLLSFRKIAGNPRYKRFLNFASFKNPPKDVRDTLPTKRIPSIVIFFSDFNEDHEIDFKKNPIRMGGYQGSILVKSLEKYFDEFIQKNAKGKKKSGDVSIKQINNSKEWKVCEGKVFCIVLFMNENGESKRVSELKKAAEDRGERFDRKAHSVTSIMGRIKGKNSDRNIDVFYIDANCHHDVLPDFGLTQEDLPKAIAIWDHKKQYSVMTADFSFETVDLWTKRVSRRSVPLKNYKPGWRMHDRNCAQYKQQVLEWQARDAKKAYNETINQEDELMKEVIEETKKRELEKKKGKGKKKGKKKQTYWD